MDFYILDDDIAVVKTLKHIISDREIGTVAGYNTDVECAIADIREERPEIIMVDFMMKEIFEQPRTIRDTLAGRMVNGHLKFDELTLNFEELAAILEECDKLNAEDKVDEVLANFTTFNDFIYEKCQMTRLKEIVNELRTYVIYFRDLSIRSSERRTKALNEHKLIYRGMLNKDVEQITLITHEHLDRSLQFILKQMEKLHID